MAFCLFTRRFFRATTVVLLKPPGLDHIWVHAVEEQHFRHELQRVDLRPQRQETFSGLT